MILRAQEAYKVPHVGVCMSIGQTIRKMILIYFGMLVAVLACGAVVELLSPGLFFGWLDRLHELMGVVTPAVEEGWKGKGERVLRLAVLLFVAPVALTENYLLSLAGFTLPLEGWTITAHGIVVFILSWIVWSTAATRSLKFAGVYDPFWNAYGRERGLVLRAFLRVRDWWEMLRRFGREATGGWASLTEVVSHRFCAGDIFLGRPKLFIGGMLRPVGIKTEKHMVTIAGTGAGKSTAALIPNLCLHEGSLLAVDCKGELSQITAARRSSHGPKKGWGLDQGVYVVDPYKIAGEGHQSASYNPFDEIARVAIDDADRAVSYAAKISEALVKPMSEKESYWDNAAKTFIRGLILYIFAYEPKEKRNLLRLRELVMQGDVAGYEEAVAAKVVSRGEVTAFDVLLERMKGCRGQEYGDAISSAAASIVMMGEGQRGSVVTTAQEHTAFLDTPEIRKVSETSSFLLEDFKTDWMSVYLVLPLNQLKGAEGRWLRMFIMLFIDMMMRIQKAPNPPVLLAIDEFPNLGRLEGIELVAPVMRSYGVRFWAVAQDIGQLKAVYPDTWTGFIGGAEAVQFMGVNHPATVDFIVERLGERVVKGSEGKETMRPLLDRDQVSRFLAKKNKNQIIWFGHQKPMKLKLCPYYEYLPWWYYSPDPRFRESILRRMRRWIADF